MMPQEIITNLYTNAFVQDRLQNFLSLLSSSQEKVNKEVPITGDYSAVAASCRQIMTCWDAQETELPVYFVKLQPEGRLIDLDQQFISEHFSAAPYLLAVVCRPDQEEWYLSFCQQKLVVARNYYYTCNHQFSHWFQKQIGRLAEKRKLVWSDLEAAFDPQQLRDQFINDCERLIDKLAAEIDQKSAQNLVLQLAVVFFLQQQGWLGGKEASSTGDRELLVTLYQTADKSSDYWQDYLQPLLVKIFATGQTEEKYLDYKVPCLGKTAELLVKEEPVADGLVKEVLVTFNQYSFSGQENTPWRQQVALTPKVLSDLFERLVKDDQRKRRGVVYTPPGIVNYLAQEGIANYLTAKVSQLADESIERFVYYGEIPGEIKREAAVIDSQLAEMKLCDPAVGSGAFAVGAQQEIVKLRRKLSRFIDGKQTLTELRQETVVNSIYGVEINQQAVKIARLRLWFNSAAAEADYSQTQYISSFKYNFVVGNSLFKKENNLFDTELQELKKLQEEYLQTTDLEARKKLEIQIDSLLGDLPPDSFSFPHYFPTVFADKGGFDLIIGNPPYVGEKGNKDLFRRLQASPLGRFYQGKMDLFYFFFHLGLDVVASDGHVVYITTNYFLRATGAQKLRTDLKKRATVKKLINFNELKLFRAAIGQHNLISVLQKGTRDISAQTVVADRKGTVTTEDLDYFLYGTDGQAKKYLVPQSSLYEGEANYLRLQQGTVTQILNKVKQQGTPLGELCNINQGIVTGCDRISRRHLQQYDLNLDPGRGVFVIDRERRAEFDVTNKDKWFKPWFKNSHIDTWIPQQGEVEERLLYLDHRVKELPAAIRKHLLPAREVLSQRREVSRGRIKWWQLQWPRQKEMFTGPKLIAPQRHRYNVFAYTEQPWYASADVYYITQQETGCSLKYLLALLNSKLYYLWLYRKGKKKGDILELYQRPLSEVPIKVIAPDQQQKFIAVVDRIMTEKRRLQQLTSVSWQQLFPQQKPPCRLLRELARDYQVDYRGQAQKVRQIKVEIEGRTGIIYSAREQGGWYQVLQMQLADKKLARYVKYYLKNLTDEERRQINDSQRGLVDRILNIKLPIYSVVERNKLVDKWSQLTRQISKLKQAIAHRETKINKLVYELYNLDQAEQNKIKRELSRIDK